LSSTLSNLFYLKMVEQSVTIVVNLAASVCNSTNLLSFLEDKRLFSQFFVISNNIISIRYGDNFLIELK
jgi:hypothetical protein